VMLKSAFIRSVGAAATGLLAGASRQSSGHLGYSTQTNPELSLHRSQPILVPVVEKTAILISASSRSPQVHYSGQVVYDVAQSVPSGCSN
jgi:hypothetical protein